MSSSQLKPIKVWGNAGPNPPKVLMLLEELNVPYEAIPIPNPLKDLKQPDYLKVNPNGRIPAIYDANTDITLWESGAILEYLIERYDTGHKLSFAPGTVEAAHARQWLFYQVSGQGPYYGQAVWFKVYHQEDVPSARKRYNDEVARVTGVLEGHLARQKEAAAAAASDADGDGDSDGPWLVGNKFSYADLSFLPWQDIIPRAVGIEGHNPDNFPLVKDWLQRMLARPALKKVMDEANAYVEARRRQAE